MAHRLPTSFLPPRALAPILVVTFGVAVLLEIVSSVDTCDAHGWAAVLTAPIIGTTLTATFAVRRRVAPTLGVAFGTLFVQALGALVILQGQFLWQLGVAMCVATALGSFVVMMPLFVLAGWLGRRDDHDADLEAGDFFLGSASALFTIVNLLVAAFAEGNTAKSTLLGGVFGLALFGAAATSIVRRRCWLAKVRRGAMPGLRIRSVGRADERAVPAIFGRREDAHHVVVERKDLPITAYRGEAPDVPLLTVPA